MPDNKEQTNLPTPPDDDSEKSASSGGMPRRRRLVPKQSADSSQGAESSDDKPSAAPPIPKAAAGGAQIPPAPKPAQRESTVAAIPGVQASSGSTSDKETEENEQPKDPNQLSSGQRIMRVVLILAILGVCWIGLLMNLQKSDAETRRSERKKLNMSPAKAEKIDFSKSDKVAEDILATIRAGEIGDIIKTISAKRAIDPNNPRLQNVLLLAESVAVVRELAAQLEALPLPDLNDTTISLEENISREEARHSVLQRLRAQRADWGDKLFKVSGMTTIYSTHETEMENAYALIQSWQTSQSQIRQALAAVKGETPNLRRCSMLLQQAAGGLPLALVGTTARDAAHLEQVRRYLNRRVIDQAVAVLKDLDFSDVTPPVAAGAPSPAAEATETIAAETAATSKTEETPMLIEIRQHLRQYYELLQRRVGDWDKLNVAKKESRKLYKQGNVDQAIALMEDALAKADRTNKLTDSLVQEVTRLLEHDKRIQKAWEKSLAAKESGDLAAQLSAWTEFQSLLGSGDDYYRSAFLQELRVIKDTMREDIATISDRIQKIQANYEPMTLDMRKPENPRAPFTRAATLLRNMAVEAAKIRDIAALVPQWEFGFETEQQIRDAKSILADHNSQASILFNLYTTYNKRGNFPYARECLERVKILGDLSSNPWYAEAVKLLEE